MIFYIAIDNYYIDVLTMQDDYLVLHVNYEHSAP